MSLIIYKQRHHNSNVPRASVSNYNYVKYIATRDGAMFLKNKDHGLFGKMQVGDLQNFHSYKEIASMVQENTRDRIIMYQGVISFKEETAREIGLTSLEQWQRYIEKNIYTLAEKNKIPVTKLQWAAAIHDEKGHPHAHVVFWDKDPLIQRAFVNSEIPKSIQQQLTKDTFGDRIYEIGQAKDELAKKIRVDSKTLGDDLSESVGMLGRKRYELIRGVYREGLKEYKFSFQPEILNTLAQGVFRLKESVPKTGRLSYKLLPQETKILVDDVVQAILSQSPEMAQTVDDYVLKKTQQMAIYRTPTEKQISNYREEAEKMLANGVMNMVRSLNELDWQYQKESFEEEERRFFMEQMLEFLSEMFREKEDTTSFKKFFPKGELSKEAKRELYLKNQDKGYEH